MSFNNELALLLEMTKGCRHDMHEPDNEGVEAMVMGNHLDNAMGINRERALRLEDLFWDEFVVVLRRREMGKPDRIERFNLCSLIALARMAKLNG